MRHDLLKNRPLHRTHDRMPKRTAADWGNRIRMPSVEMDRDHGPKPTRRQEHHSTIHLEQTVRQVISLKCNLFCCNQRFLMMTTTTTRTVRPGGSTVVAREEPKEQEEQKRSRVGQDLYHDGDDDDDDGDRMRVG